MASVAPFVVPLVLGVLFASYTSKIAGRKGRNPVAWGTSASSSASSASLAPIWSRPSNP